VRTEYLEGATYARRSLLRCECDPRELGTIWNCGALKFSFKKKSYGVPRRSVLLFGSVPTRKREGPALHRHDDTCRTSHSTDRAASERMSAEKLPGPSDIKGVRPGQIARALVGSGACSSPDCPWIDRLGCVQHHSAPKLDAPKTEEASTPFASRPLPPSGLSQTCIRGAAVPGHFMHACRVINRSKAKSV
jgi:hypothetical protein